MSMLEPRRWNLVSSMLSAWHAWLIFACAEVDTNATLYSVGPEAAGFPGPLYEGETSVIRDTCVNELLSPLSPALRCGLELLLAGIPALRG